MASMRVILLVVFFLGLAALEVGHGVFRLDTIRDQRQTEILETVGMAHADLVRDIHNLLAEGRRHADYLARTPGVLAVLAGKPAATGELRRQLLPYLVAFRELDRVRVLDAKGRERFRAERVGNGVGAIPAALLESAPDAGALAVAQGLRSGEVAVSGLDVDLGRVEVAPDERQVLHYVTPVADEETGGLLVLTVYAAPLLGAVRGFDPIPGTRSFLLDSRGTDLAQTEATGASSSPSNVGAPGEPRPAIPALRGETRLRVGGDTWFGLPVASDPDLRLLTRVPDAAVDGALGSLTSEYFWVIASTVGITIILAAAGVWFLKQGMRAFRLRETERYLVRIRRESEKYQALMEGAADMILIVQPVSHRVVEMNARAREKLGAGSGPPDPRPLPERLGVEDAQGLHGALDAAAADASHPVALPDLRIRDQAGREHAVDARLAGIDLAEERVIEVSLRDLTVQRDLERRLRVADRLSSIGLLTAGVAHEINNPLAGIANYLVLLGRDDLSRERRERHLENVRYGFERIRDIVRDLLRFARPEKAEGRADLGQAIERALSMLRYSKEFREIDVQVSGLDSARSVAFDPGHLEQVLLNLFLNAATAMQGTGSIAIAVTAEAPGKDEGDRIRLSVSDSGPGIRPEDLPRVFDPFFTTRPQGTGLGLAISYTTVEAHGGHLEATNGPQGGAVFTLVLPVGAPLASPVEKETR